MFAVLSADSALRHGDFADAVVRSIPLLNVVVWALAADGTQFLLVWADVFEQGIDHAANICVCDAEYCLAHLNNLHPRRGAAGLQFGPVQTGADTRFAG